MVVYLCSEQKFGSNTKPFLTLQWMWIFLPSANFSHLKLKKYKIIQRFPQGEFWFLNLPLLKNTSFWAKQYKAIFKLCYERSFLSLCTFCNIENSPNFNRTCTNYFQIRYNLQRWKIHDDVVWVLLHFCSSALIKTQ